MGEKGNVDIRALAALALDLGATEAAPIDVGTIRVEDKLAGYCREPRCECYGGSASCPPYVGGPDEFRKWIAEMKTGVVFKIDLPADIFFSSDRREVGRLLCEIAASLEIAARGMGAAGPRAFAGGSCRRMFCTDEPDCRVVDRNGPCRHPDQARPSMSGYGVNVRQMVESAGMTMHLANRKDDPAGESLGSLVGLVLVE